LFASLLLMYFCFSKSHRL